MKTFFSWLTGLVACVSFVYAAHEARGDFVLGTFDSTRATTANLATGLYTQELLASLNAHYPGMSIDTAPTLSPSFLAGVDVLVISSAMTDLVGITPLSAGEQAALADFVQAGGRACLVVDGWAPFIAAAQSIVSPFGMTIIDDGLTGIRNATPTTHAHPVINGPFGDTTGIAMFGAGLFTNLGPYATSLATLDGTGLPALAAIEAQALGSTSGRVVLVADASPFVDGADGGFFPLSETFILNTMEYLLVPEPSGWILAIPAASGLGLTIAARSLRRRFGPKRTHTRRGRRYRNLTAPDA